MSGALHTPASDYDVWSKTRAVLAYDRNPAQQGRPLSLMLGGAGLALVALALILMLAYRTWYLGLIDQERAWFGVSLLFVFYVGGVFIFSCAYELYDLARAVRLTFLLAFVSVIAIFIVIGVLALLAKTKGGVGILGGKGDDIVPLLGGVLAGDEDESESPFSTGDPEVLPQQPLTIGCGSCGTRFTPAPPSAVCPACGRPALAV